MVDAVNSGVYTVDLGGEEVTFTKDDLLITVKSKEGFVSAADHGITAVLDKTLTPDLIREGYVRELVSKVQSMRKEAGFEVIDHILLSVKTDDAELAALLYNSKEEISASVLGDGYGAATEGFTKDLDLNDVPVTVTVQKV